MVQSGGKFPAASAMSGPSNGTAPMAGPAGIVLPPLHRVVCMPVIDALPLPSLAEATCNVKTELATNINERKEATAACLRLFISQLLTLVLALVGDSSECCIPPH